MSSFFKPHRLLAFAVLIGAGAWVATGEFAAVGMGGHSSEAAEPAEAAAPAPEAAPEAGPPMRTVSVATPLFKDHARVIRLSGITAPDKSTMLAARTEGIVKTLDLEKGQMVDEGAVVMTLEGPEVHAQAKIAQITLDQAKRDLDVAERLYRGGNKAETAYNAAVTAMKSAEAALALANASVDRLTLRTPFAGMIDTVEIEPGEWVQGGAPVASLLALDPIVVKIEVSERDVGFFAPGAKARVTLVTGQEREGTISYIAREASAQTRTFPVEVRLANSDYKLPAGMTAQVELLAPPVKAVTVPRSVITLSEDGDIGLRVVGDDDIAQFAPVGIIDDTPDGLVVTGVPSGSRIVVAGQDLVRDGDKVKTVEDAQVTE